MSEKQSAYKRHLVEVLGIEESVAESMTLQNTNGRSLEGSKARAIMDFTLWSETTEGGDYWAQKYLEALTTEQQKGQQ